MTETTSLTAGANARAGAAWMAELEPGLRQLVEANGCKTQRDLAAAFAELQRAVGSGKVALPKNGVWDDVAREQDETDSTAMLQKEWGKAYDAKRAQAISVARRFGGDALIERVASYFHMAYPNS